MKCEQLKNTRHNVKIGKWVTHSFNKFKQEYWKCAVRHQAGLDQLYSYAKQWWFKSEEIQSIKDAEAYC